MKAKQVNNSEVNKTEEPITAEFEVVREVKLGRPLFLTARRFIKICQLIEKGESVTHACQQMLVGYSLLRKHVQRNPKYLRRLKRAEEVREDWLREFHIANIRKHASKNLLASLWWLERRHPNQFALRNFARAEGAGDQPIGDKVSEADLKRYAEQMAEFQKSSALPAPENP